MRAQILMSVVWMAALQAVVPVASIEGAGKLLVAVGVLGPVTVVLYRLAASQLKALIELVLRRLEAIEHMLADLVERGARMQRWQARVDRRLDRLESRQHEAEVVE